MYVYSLLSQSCWIIVNSMSKEVNVSESLLVKDKRPYVLWRRVSTKEQGGSGLGLAAQLTIARAFTGREPVKVYTDVYSGTKLKECFNLWKAIDYCKENECLLVIAKSDRCRNVSQAIEILDKVGDGNLVFCDTPSSDRFVLTILWAMWERQATMGRINTKIALDERKKQADRDGGWVSKRGNWREHLGNDKGCDMMPAVKASAKKRSELGAQWRETSPGYQWVRRQLLRGKMSRNEIIEEFNENMRLGVPGFSSMHGKPLTAALLSLWAKEILHK